MFFYYSIGFFLIFDKDAFWLKLAIYYFSMVRGCGVFICNLLFYKLVFCFRYVYVNICVGKDWKEDCEYK